MQDTEGVSKDAVTTIPLSYLAGDIHTVLVWSLWQLHALCILPCQCGIPDQVYMGVGDVVKVPIYLPDRSVALSWKMQECANLVLKMHKQNQRLQRPMSCARR